MSTGALVLMIPIVAIICGTIVRVMGRRSESGAEAMVADLTGRLDALESELGSLRHELTETQERLDFTERLLAEQRPNPPLHGGGRP